MANENIQNVSKITLGKSYFSVKGTSVSENYRDHDNYYFNDKWYNHVDNVRRGNIEIRRIFNNDEFVMRIVLSQIEENFETCYKGLTILINNKMLDPELLKQAMFQRKVTRKFVKCYDKGISFEEKWGEKWTKNNYMTSIILTSQMLNMKFKDLENMTITFFNIENKPDFWQIKREKFNKTNENVINTNDNKVKISIPEYYKFTINEFGEVKREEKNYDIDINFEKLNFYDRQRKLATLTGTGYKHKVMDSLTLHTGYLEKWTLGTREFFNNLEASEHAFTKNQSIYNFGLKNFENDQLGPIDKNIEVNLKTTSYVDGVENREVLYNNFVDYNYEKGALENNGNLSERGLFIPYNFKGKLINRYQFYFEQKENQQRDDILNLKINNVQNVKQELLNPYTGSIKLKSEEIENVDDEEFRYEFSKEQIEWFLKIAEPLTAESLKEYIKNDKEN